MHTKTEKAGAYIIALLLGSMLGVSVGGGIACAFLGEVVFLPACIVGAWSVYSLAGYAESQFKREDLR